MERELLKLSHLPFDYEDEKKQERALEVLPLEELYATAQKAVEADTENKLGFEDQQMIAFLKWFKSWMEWVNNAPCTKCGSKETTGLGAYAATPEESRYGAGHAEVYGCPKCETVTRFPRYNDPLKIMETRQGRCGEYANLATLFARSLGYNVRYIWNSEDHVWGEVWSTHLNRWCHFDSCEAAYDHPQIYTDGWGKKMAYCVAFSIGGTRDVTKRYVKRQEMQLPRDRIDEHLLEALLKARTSEIRQNMDPVEEVEWFERDEQEQDEFQGKKTPSKAQTALPRQSGSASWVASRGEDGK